MFPFQEEKKAAPLIAYSSSKISHQLAYSSALSWLEGYNQKSNKQINCFLFRHTKYIQSLHSESRSDIIEIHMSTLSNMNLYIKLHGIDNAEKLEKRKSLLSRIEKILLDLSWKTSRENRIWIWGQVQVRKTWNSEKHEITSENSHRVLKGQWERTTWLERMLAGEYR